jgi:hypothetical protein
MQNLFNVIKEIEKILGNQENDGHSKVEKTNDLIHEVKKTLPIPKILKH